MVLTYHVAELNTFLSKMRRKPETSIFPLMIVMGVFLAFASSCEKDDDNEPSPNNPTNGQTTAVFNPAVTYGTMTDQGGNVYKTVTIGTQTWMAENLRTTKYSDGTTIPNVTDGIEWGKITTGAYCRNDLADISTYGYLYNWYAVNTGKLAPAGWHVATDAEWTTLITYLGGESVAGGRLKETGTTHWQSPNTGATNESGFTALPSGDRVGTGTFYGFGSAGGWWCSDASTALERGLFSTVNSVKSSIFPKEVGCSIRCVKD